MTVGPKTTLTLKRSTSVDDGMGGATMTWTKIKNVTGVLSTLSDRERMMYGKKAEESNYKFVVDYQFVGDATTRDQFYDGTRVFSIDSRENPMNTNRLVVFLLNEKVDG